MRVVQVIDSLEAGGAERIAVSYANSLVNRIAFSGLISTRKEGILKEQLNSEVPYLFLNRKNVVDFKAVFLFRKYLVKNQVNIVHAHGSSFFIAVLVKLTLPKIKIIWHDHYGTRAIETKKKNKVLALLSNFFSSVFVVNYQLEEWSRKNLQCSNVVFIPNFATSHKNEIPVTTLEGMQNKRIVFLANLKEPKNHILILKSFQELKLDELEWSLHLIGKDYEDGYSKVIKDFIKKHSLGNSIYLYGVRSDINHILTQATIGVLASTEEGFPVTLLEYGLANLGVIATNVGYCSVIINENENGLLFSPLSSSEVKEQLYKMVTNNDLVTKFGNKLNEKVLENYSEAKVIQKLIDQYKSIQS